GVTTTAGHIRNITVEARGGNDTVIYQTTGDLVSRRNLTVDLGNGDDFFRANYLGKITGADQNVIVNGGLGNEVIRVVANADVDITCANGTFQLNGNIGKDPLDVVYAGELHGRLTPLLDGGDGADIVRVNAHFESGSGGDVFTSLKGSFGDDQLSARLVKD